MDLEENYELEKGKQKDPGDEQKEPGDELEKGKQKDSGDDGDEKDTKKSAKKKSAKNIF